MTAVWLSISHYTHGRTIANVQAMCFLFYNTVMKQMPRKS